MAERVHCDDFRRENEDTGIRRPAHDMTDTPLDRLMAGGHVALLAGYSPEATTVRRAQVTFITNRTSFDVWAALASLEDLLSDYRRIARRFRFMQTAGEANIAVGNEYRLTLSDPAPLSQINAAIGNLSSGQTNPIEQRVMDVRVVRTGPWGGETGELVTESLRNHALAGASSLWILAHDDSDDGNMRVTLDGLEIARWAWAPDFLGGLGRRGDTAGASIIDWDYLFERLAQRLDGVPEAAKPGACFSVDAARHVVTRDNRVAEALEIHVGLKPFLERMS